MFSQNVNFNSGKIGGNLIQSKVNNVQNNNDYSGIILYLHYPNYINHSKNTFSGIVGNLWDKSSLSEKKIPVGHSAIILIDKFGNTKYYEYGRYNYQVAKNTYLVGAYIENYGNFRRTIIPNKIMGESLKEYIKRIKNKLPSANAGDLEVTVLSHVDTKAAEKYILKLANDRTRKKYSETNTCATLASDVAIKFQAPNYKQGNFINGIYEIFNNNDAYNIISDVMTLIPYTSHNYNAEIRNRGDETFYFDE